MPAKKITILKCQVCGHEWQPRRQDPALCPNCKSPSWKTGRQRPPIAVQRARAAERRAKLEAPSEEEKTKRLRDALAKLGKFIVPANENYKIAGVVNAGPWREVTEEEMEMVSSFSLLGWRDGDFMLVISPEEGECLINDGIYPNDIVHLRPGGSFVNDDIVLATGIDDHGRFFATLKHYFERGEVVTLQPSNPRHRPIRARKGDVEVEAVLINAIRRNFKYKRPTTRRPAVKRAPAVKRGGK